MNYFSTLIPRVSTEESTFALVMAEVTFSPDPAVFLSHLKKALTRWVEFTDQGKRAWEISSRDFNIGDLSSEAYNEGDLAVILAGEGIHHLSIQTFCDHRVPLDWTYDTVLVDEESLPPSEDPSL